MNKPKLSLETLWIQEQPGPFAVLAVSPNRTAVAFLEKMMRPLAGRKRVEMTQARSVSEAVNELDLGPFHLCLFDVDLGEAALLRWLKTIRAHENKLPVILLTTPDQEEVTVRGLLEGARDYLFKSSLAPELLLRSMHYSLERERETAWACSPRSSEEGSRLAAETPPPPTSPGYGPHETSTPHLLAYQYNPICPIFVVVAEAAPFPGLGARPRNPRSCAGSSDRLPGYRKESNSLQVSSIKVRLTWFMNWSASAPSTSRWS